MRKTQFVLLLFLLSSLAACDGKRDYLQNELNGARIQWGQTEPESFRMLYVRYCFCLFCSEVLIAVDNGAITSSEYWPSGLPAPEEDTRCVRVSVDRMFDEIQHALDRDYEIVEVTYDQDYGYPAESYLRSSIDLADDGSRQLASLLLPPTTPPDYGDGPIMLDRRRARWTRTSPHSYEYSVSRTCDCPGAGVAEITVEGGEIASVLVNGQLLEDYLAEGWQWDITVEKLFSVIQAAYTGQAHGVSVSYGELGVPSHIAIDWFSDREDDRVEFSISDFREIGQ